MHSFHGESMEDTDKLLYQAYATTMQLAQRHRLQHIAFSLLSAGIFRGPRDLDDILEVGVRAIKEHACVWACIQPTDGELTRLFIRQCPAGMRD